MLKTFICSAILSIPMGSMARTDVDSKDCSFYVKDILQTKQSAYGSSREYFLFRMQLPDEAIELGMDAVYSDGTRVLEETMYAAHLGGRPQDHIAFDTVRRDDDGDKQPYHLIRFAFFYDSVAMDGDTVRQWFKNSDGNYFTGEHVDERQFFYTRPQIWGYGSAKYLRHDSGSPIFDLQNACN